jgi:hypothetical protein
VPVTWGIKDSDGELLARFIAGSPREVGRKVVSHRYDAFRLEVSRSYRELFDRDLKGVLAREQWQIVPIKPGIPVTTPHCHGRSKFQRRRRSDGQLELKLN